LVVCTNSAYLSRYKNLNTNIFYVPHGVAKEEFNVNQSEVERIQNVFGSFAILIGNIGKDFNIDLLEKIVAAKINIVIIGESYISDRKWEQLCENDNLHFLGHMNQLKIKNYISASKVGLVMYQFDNKITSRSRTPLKILNYLAQKKPIISSIKVPLESLESKVIYYAFDITSYVNTVKLAMEDKLDVDSEATSDYLSKVMYPNLITKILSKLKSC